MLRKQHDFSFPEDTFFTLDSYSTDMFRSFPYTYEILT